MKEGSKERHEEEKRVGQERKGDKEKRRSIVEEEIEEE